MKKRLLNFGATLLCAAFTLGITACSALFEKKDVYPELDPVNTSVNSEDAEDKTVYITDETVLSAEINEEGNLVVTPIKPGTSDVSFFDTKNKTYITHGFEVSPKGELIENPVTRVAGYKDIPAKDFWFNKISDVKIEDSDILFAQIRNEGQYVRLISKVLETDDDGIYKKVSKITVTGLTEKASDSTETTPFTEAIETAQNSRAAARADAADETNPADAPETTSTTSTAVNEDTVSVFAAVDFDSVSETRIKMNAPQVLPYDKYTLEEVALESVDKASITNNKDLELVEVNKNNEIIVSVRTYQEEGISDTITIPQSAYVYTQIQRTFQTNTLPFTSNSSVNKIVLPSFSSTNTELTELISEENEIECDNTKSVTPKIENGTLLLIPGETAGDAKITISDDDGNSYTFYTETKIDDTKTPAVLQVVAYDNIKLTEETLEEDFDFDFDFEDVTSGKTQITINQPKNEGENPVIEIAEPSEDGLLFRAMHAGETSITITEEDGSKHFMKFTVADNGTVSASVDYLPIESLVVEKSNIEVYENENSQTVAVSYSKGSGYLKPEFTVSSSNEKIATASLGKDDNGNEIVIIDGQKSGNATITIKDTVSELSQEISVSVVAKNYSITINDVTGGTITASKKTAVEGDKVTLTQSANTGYTFKEYAVTCNNAEVKLSGKNAFIMPKGDVVISAVFTANDYSITLPTITGGTITANKTSANYDDEIELTVTPNDGYKLTSGSLTVKQGNTTVSVSDNKFKMPAGNVTVSASFTAIDYTITIGTIKNGNVKTDKPTAHVGDSVKITQTADEGYTLESLKVTSGDKEVTVSMGVFTMPAGNVTVNATYTATGYTISTKTGIQNGTVTSSKPTAYVGDEITLEPKPDTGYKVKSITIEYKDKTETVTNNKFTMPADNVIINATFIAIDYTITSGTSTNGKVTANKTTAHIGDTVTLTATPDDGYQVEKYQITSGGKTTEQTSSTFIMPAGNVTVSATFGYKDYSISVSNVTGGTLTANKTTAHFGDEITLTAKPSTGYILGTLFVKDSSNNDITTTHDQNDSTKYTFTMPADDVTVDASFTLINYTVTVDGNITNGSVSPSTTTNAHVGETITLTPSPATGYQLGTLTVKQGTKDVTVTNNTFIMPAGNVTVTATFVGKKGYNVGDVLLNTGTIIPHANVASMTDVQIDSAVGVLYALDDEGNPRGWLGLHNSGINGYAWAEDYTTGYETKFEDIICTPSATGSGAAYTATFTGDTDGSNNWAYICSQDSSGTTNAATNYPAFNYVNNYASTFNLTGDYAKGWYMPSIAELSYIYRNKDELNSVLKALEGIQLYDVSYWSSSQLNDRDSAAWTVVFSNGEVRFGWKGYPDRVCCVHKFSFKNYPVSISTITNGSVEADKTTAYAEETVTLTVAPSTGYQLATLSVKDSSNATITHTVDQNDSTKYTFTMPAGNVTVSATFEGKKGYNVGDVKLNDGTIIPHANVASMPNDQKAAAVGVLYALDDEGNPRGWLGLYNSAGGTNWGTYAWAKADSTGYNTKFEDIICTPSDTGSGAAYTATFTGDTDGSNNWAYICQQDPTGTADAATNYPAFNYVNNYATTANLTGDYATGWYMPSIAELCYIYRNKAVLNSVLKALGRIPLGNSDTNFLYWSSSQNSYNNWFALSVQILNGEIRDESFKNWDFLSVCCIHKFSFSEDVLPNYPVSISNMTNGTVTTNKTTAHAGETVTLTVAPSTGYQLATLSVKDSSNATITHTVDPSDSTKYTFTMPDTIVSVTATFESTSSAVTYSVGDVLLNTGTIIPYANVNTMTDGQKAAAVGVLYALDENGTPRGWLGIYNSAGGTNRGYYSWAYSGTTGYNTKFEDIVCSPNAAGVGVASTANFTDDTDGSNNWAYICSQDSSGTSDAATNYPAFNYVNNYASTFNLTGDYATGWYMPSLAELCYIYRNKAVLNSVLTALGGIQLNDNNYWPSSQGGVFRDYAWYVGFGNGNVACYGKNHSNHVCCIHKFSFTDSLPNYPVSISTMTNGSVTTNKTTAHAGETVTLTVAPSSNYILYSLNVKDSSNAKITITKDPSDSTKYTFTMPDTIVKVSATFGEVRSVGDVLLNDGTIIPHANVASMTDVQIDSAVGVLYALDENGTPRGWLGLQDSGGTTYYEWAKNRTTGYKTKFTDIICTPSKTVSGAASTATFTGDTDGSDNWAYICQQDPTGTADAATNYPAFNYVNNYATTANLTGDYASGWYMPSLAELCYIYRNKSNLNSVLNKLNANYVIAYDYWSSSQGAAFYDYAWCVDLSAGVLNDYYKTNKKRVCCVRAF